MTHLTDDDLVLYYYAEGEGLPEAREHLGACPACQQKLDALRQALEAVSASAVPERDDSYGRMVWARLQPQLRDQRARTWWRRLMAGFVTWPRFTTATPVADRGPRLALAGGMAVLLVAAFVAGHNWQGSVAPAPGTRAEQPITAPTTASADGDSQRVLLGAVGGHLERSARILLEVTNGPTDGPTDVSAEQSWAGDLVAANRLYRQTAQRQGEAGLADLLEELERVLVEISNSPAQMSAEQFQALRKRIDDRGLIFKVRVLESQVQERQRASGTKSVLTKAAKS